MKEIFTGYFNITLSGSIIILAVILLRMIFKKAPKAILCLLWGFVFLRLLIPVQIETGFSIRPETPILSSVDTSIIEQETSFGFYPSWEIENELVSDLPSFIPQQKITPQDAVVDYVYIGTLLWAVGVVGMLIYTVATYIRLRLRLREAVRQERNIFESARINSPFLLGFFLPQIYLPTHMDEESRTVVIAHEQTHIRRGDHWFKLAAFICLALHWYNPLVWIAYSLLCRDIESACDEAVIREMDEQGRAGYSSALLNCEKSSRSMAGCPIAFGEVSVSKRIVNVLNYKKPAIWVTVIAMIAVLFSGACLMTDPVDDSHPQYYEELTQLLGEPMDVVCSELGFTQEDLHPDVARGIYWAPVDSINYQGVELRLQLGFASLDESMELVLHSFTYLAEYTALNDAFAEDTVTLAHHLYKNLGRGYQWAERIDEADPDFLRDVTVENVKENIYNKGREGAFAAISSESWDLSQIAGKNVKDYLNQFEASALWENIRSDRVKSIRPHFYHTFSAAGIKENGELQGWIKLSYACHIQPGQYGTGDLEWEQEMSGTWWKRLQDWLK